MNSFCRSIARRAFARERLPSLQFNYYCYYSTSAAKPRFRATTKTTAFKRPPPPPEQPTYTLSSPSSGAKPAQSSASSSSSSSVSASSNKVKWERPSEIPFQAKVANSVQLTGYIPKPVHFQTTPDGKPWASTTITTQRPSSSSASLPLWIPIIFEGDLAHIATCHLKENDFVYITGQLSKHLPWMNANQNEASVQVMVQNLNFVETSEMVKESVHIIEEVMSSDSDSEKKDGDAALSPWRDLIDNPKQWSDYRSKKRDGLVKPKYPDFKRKDGSLSIWLNRAPKWALSELEGLEFDNQNKNFKGTKQSKDVLWEDLMENPDKWWDNRQNKLKESQPDFKHKENGEVLWLNSSPAWALSKLPPPKPPKNGVATGKS